jgi:hypothetical protein
MYNSIQIEYSKLFSERFQNSFGHYFRNLYHIFKFIYLSNLIKDKEKKFYASITRAQLSEDELESAVYNGIAEEYGNPKFTFLINEYDLFQNMNWNSKFLDPRFQIIYENLKNKINNPFKDN